MTKAEKKGEDAKKKAAAPALPKDIRIADVRMMDLADIRAAADNPKEWNATEFGLVDASLHRFGLAETLLWNERTKRLVDGHLRLAALRRAGVKRASFCVVDWTAQEEMAFRYVIVQERARGRVNPKKAKKQLAETQQMLPDVFAQFALGEIPGQAESARAAAKATKKPKKPSADKWEPLGDVSVPPGVKAVVMEKLAAIAKLNGWPLEKGGLGQAMEKVFADLEPVKYGRASEETGG